MSLGQTPDETESPAALVEPTSPPGGGETVIPDPADYPDPLAHKLALAAGGCYLLPVDPATKHPGSYAHEGWPLKSSRDERLIRQWHGVDRGHATVIHTGRSGLVVIDLDLDGDEIPDGFGWCREGLFQTTRAVLLDTGVDCVRGHYVFASGGVTFVSGKCKLADGTVVGEVRSGNTVIVTQPSAHVDAQTKGGGYRWMSWGAAPPLPAEALRRLRVLGGPTERVNGVGHPIPPPGAALTFKNVAEWLDRFDDDYEPELLTAEVERFWKLVGSGDNRHDAMLKVVVLALRKARVRGSFSARRAERLLRAAWLQVIAPDYPHHLENEFDRMLPWVIARIEAELKTTKTKRPLWVPSGFCAPFRSPYTSPFRPPIHLAK